MPIVKGMATKPSINCLTMKNLTTILVVFLMGWATSNAALPDDERNYRGYGNNIIFNEGGIEFAVFPDGQFDFNYLDNGPQYNVQFHGPNTFVSFNTGYDYDRFVQYDAYGAVVQIENTPIFYDPYGRVNQIGNIFIDYRRGFVSRIGNLRVNYRGGVIVSYNGFINNYNPYYVYQPWHNYYLVPAYNRCVVFQSPYRRFYNPVRYSWNYHNTYWNSPSYYNGRYARASERRTFYRPNQRVAYNDFETGRRDNRGRMVATNDMNSRRSEIATGRRTIDRNDQNVRSSAVSSRSNERAISSSRSTDSSGRSSSRNATVGTSNRSNSVARSSDARALQTRQLDRSSRSTAGDSAGRSGNNRATSSISRRETTRPTAASSSNQRTASSESSRSSNRNSTATTSSRTATRSTAVTARSTSTSEPAARSSSRSSRSSRSSSPR